MSNDGDVRDILRVVFVDHLNQSIDVLKEEIRHRPFVQYC